LTAELASGVLFFFFFVKVLEFSALPADRLPIVCGPLADAFLILLLTRFWPFSDLTDSRECQWTTSLNKLTFFVLFFSNIT
jgi:hypothetical protein